MGIHRITKIIFATLFVIGAVQALHFTSILPINATLLIGLRIVACTLIGVLAWRRKSLSAWILAALFIGAEVGLDFPTIAVNLDVFSKIFIQLIKTVIAPLLFGTLVMGLAGHSNMKQVGRIGLKALIYFEVVTTIALFIGLAAINFTQAGAGIQAPDKSISTKVSLPANELTAIVDTVKNTYNTSLNNKILTQETLPTKQTWKTIVLHIFPENLAKMIYEGAVLQIVIFSLLFGFGLSNVEERHRKPMLTWIEALSEVMFKFTNYIMYLAPLAVGGSIAYTISTMGVEVVGNLLKLLATLYAALILFIGLVFVPILLICRVSVKRFFEAVYEPASLAFATASSEAALPKAMTAMETFGVPRKIVSFVIPTG